jgi:aspartate/glutamate racemase
MEESMITKNNKHNPVNSEDANPRIIARRDFLKTSGAAVLGAAVIGGASSALAQDMVIPTPDWKTLSPGDSDSDMYAEQGGYNSADVTSWDGRNVFGITIGLVQMRVNLPMIPGNMGNATTFDFPMLYREMNADNVFDAMANPPTQNFCDGIVDAAQWLELQGVKAIMGNCGFFGSYQNMVREKINVPFFSSSLMMLPMMVQSMPRNKKVGVITANGPILKKVQAVENCGLSLEDKENRIVIMGCEEYPEFSTGIMANTGKYNPSKVEAEIVSVAERMLVANKDIGAILLECTELSPHAVAVQNAVHLPVWDYTTLTRWVQSGCVRRPFVGHV